MQVSCTRLSLGWNWCRILVMAKFCQFALFLLKLSPKLLNLLVSVMYCFLPLASCIHPLLSSGLYFLPWTSYIIQLPIPFLKLLTKLSDLFIPLLQRILLLPFIFHTLLSLSPPSFHVCNFLLPEAFFLSLEPCLELIVLFFVSPNFIDQGIYPIQHFPKHRDFGRHHLNCLSYFWVGATSDHRQEMKL